MFIALTRVALLAVSLTCIFRGQVDRANLNGTVTDTSGAVVPLTKVEVVDRDTGLKRSVETRPTGVYNIPGLPIGTYNLKFSREGFRGVEVQGIQLSVGQTRTVDAQLEVGVISAKIEVQAEMAALKQSNAEIGGVIAA